MSTRPATHAGSWYSSSFSKLSSQLDLYFKQTRGAGTVAGARVLIGPHAGYTYAGQRLAETFSSWDTTKVKRVFILGPSHHVYFSGKALVSRFHHYETPLGNLPVDVETTKALVKSGYFKYMESGVDEDEHSFEMHAPFIYYATKDLPQGLPHIIPIMICGTDTTLNENLAKSLLPYLEDEENTFVISSDFCHWGSRFDYTKYLPMKVNDDIITKDHLVSLTRSSVVPRPIYKSIEELDKEGMRIVSTGSYKDWKQYIATTGNTICGQKPIAIVLRTLELYQRSGSGSAGYFEWLGYSQSSKALSYSDSSVSYASGYLVIT
ncbi:MEMO1 family protein Mho1p [[Candida] anglica]|uniref:MEMO1 family protein Mho1p n=1 Tax=[Candida] anglica TaxID=148631 RepID=A0ABP0EE94_9ASCO